MPGAYSRARAAAPAAPMKPAAATRLGAAALELEAGAAPPLVLLGDLEPELEAVALVEKDCRILVQMPVVFS